STGDKDLDETFEETFVASDASETSLKLRSAQWRAVVERRCPINTEILRPRFSTSRNVFVGRCGETVSPAEHFWALIGGDVRVQPGIGLTLPLERHSDTPSCSSRATARSTGNRSRPPSFTPWERNGPR